MEEIKPKVFISYAWTNDEYVLKVSEFVKRLRSDGIDTLFDQFDLESGNSLNNFMEKCVKDQTVTHVLMLLNPAYKEKADNRSGGAGRETQIISEEVYSDLDNKKFKPIIFDVEDKQVKDVVPIYLKNRMFIDLTKIESYEDNYMVLVRELYGKPHMIKNQLGNRPSWVDDSKTVDFNLGVLSLVRESMTKGIEKITYNKSLNLLKIEFDKTIQNADYDIVGVNNYENEYKKMNPIRNLFIAVVYELIEMDRLSSFICDFFEYIDTYLSKTKNDKSGTKYLILKILKHELIIDTIAVLFKNKKYSSIYDLITYGYETSNDWTPCVGFYDFFYCMGESSIYNFDNALGRHLGNGNTYKFTGIGDCWSRNAPVEYVSFDDFVNADILITSLTGILINERWFAISYVYQRDNKLWLDIIEKALTSKRLFKRYSSLFGNMNEVELKKAIVNDHNRKDYSWFGYNNCTKRIPVLFEYNFKEDKLFSEK